MSEKPRPWLSIVIPAYNEADRIASGLGQARDYARQTGRSVEVIVIDDGSADRTGAFVAGLDLAPLAVRVLRNETNHGKGYAVRQGMLAATGQLVLMSDADFSTPIGEVAKLLEALERGYDVVIGSRDMPDSVLDPPQPLRRRLPAKVFRAVRRLLILRDLRDTQCGFKLFRRQAARDVFTRQRVDNFAFDIEALAIARKLGYRIKEVGVLWRNDPDSRVRPTLDAAKMLLSLLGIKWRLRRV